MTNPFKLNAAGTAAVATEVFWNEDMTVCPRGTKVQLLGQGGVAVYSEYHGGNFWVGWCPLPRRADKPVHNYPIQGSAASLLAVSAELEALGYDLDALERDSPYHTDPYA